MDLCPCIKLTIGGYISLLALGLHWDQDVKKNTFSTVALSKELGEYIFHQNFKWLFIVCHGEVRVVTNWKNTLFKDWIWF